MFCRFTFLRFVVLAACMLVLAAAPAFADWDPGEDHKMHFPQLPDFVGFDVNFTDPIVLADDWLCTETGPVSDIHYWFSARGDWLDITERLDSQIFNIHVSIHENIPAGVGGVPYSRPGVLLWERDYSVNDPAVKIREYGVGDQFWYDPATGTLVPSDHRTIYQCNIMDITEPFYQKRGEIYWVDVSMSSEGPLGWKTADLNRYPAPHTGNHYEDDAVWQAVGGGWQELFFPEGPFAGQSMDLAFVVTGQPIEWNHKMHFPQLPDPTGADVAFNPPTVLADDWQCSASGAVSDIHFWFSALGDWLNFTAPLSGQIFTIHVSIHEDIPDPDGTGPAYSMPGRLLWDRDYPVDAVQVTKCYTPGQDWYLAGETYVYDNHYCMYRVDIVNIDDPFVQEVGKIYWLDVWIDAEGPLGWKTADTDQYPAPYTSTHFQDDGVFGFLPTPVWRELIWPPRHPKEGRSIDLAFVITNDQPTGIRSEGLRLPFELRQNVPNPFNPSTTIGYRLYEPADVFLAVYDVNGTLVRVLEQGPKSEGTFEAEWDAHDSSGSRVASGVYFYRLTAGAFTQTKKMVLIK